jgi:hypothetical protein
MPTTACNPPYSPRSGQSFCGALWTTVSCSAPRHHRPALNPLQHLRRAAGTKTSLPAGAITARQNPPRPSENASIKATSRQHDPQFAHMATKKTTTFVRRT